MLARRSSEALLAVTVGPCTYSVTVAYLLGISWRRERPLEIGMRFGVERSHKAWKDDVAGIVVGGSRLVTRPARPM